MQDEAFNDVDFEVQWIRHCDVPFFKVQTLLNAMNDDKPITMSRDGQEISEDIGERVCEMFNKLDFSVGEDRPQPTKRSKSSINAKKLYDLSLQLSMYILLWTSYFLTYLL